LMEKSVKKWKRGDIHPVTGKVFMAYDKSIKSGEYWATQEKLDETKAKARLYHRERSVSPDVIEYKRRYYRLPHVVQRRRDKYVKKVRKPKKQTKEYLAAYNLEWKKRKWREDPIFKLKAIIRSATWRAAQRGIKRPRRIINGLGCNIVEFKAHIESKFQPGMTWENHGNFGWHVDHIIPLSQAKTPEDVVRLTHYTNLQPLWWRDNLTKAARI